MSQALEIPEILCLIYEQAQKSDLARLLTTSRLFFDCAAPIVWRSLPKSAPMILMRLLPGVDTDKHLNTNRNAALVADLLESLQPLDAQSLARFDLYAPYVKQLVLHHWNEQLNIIWDRFLKLVDRRPILPKLEVLKASIDVPGKDIDQGHYLHLSAYLCQTLVEIENIRNTFPYMQPRGLSILISSIAQNCPRVHSLRLAKVVNRVSLYTAAMGSTYAGELANSLGRLRNLHVLGLGWVAMDPGVLKALSTLPHLESLTLNEMPSKWRLWGPSKYINISLPHSSFPALKHLGIRPCFSPEPATRIWSISSLVQRLVSVSVHIHAGVAQAQFSGFICAMCRSSPYITGLYLDCADSLSYVAMFSPGILDNLAKLPLQRLRLSGRVTNFSGAPRYSEQLALAFPDMEYLRIRGFYFTFEDLMVIAKHMPRLQQLSVRVRLDTRWPSEGEMSSLALVPSPSQLYLQLQIFHFVEGREDGIKIRCGHPLENLDAIATCFHTLWPNGVICDTEQWPDNNEKANWAFEFNAVLKRLRENDGHGDQTTLSMPRKYLRNHVFPWLAGF